MIHFHRVSQLAPLVLALVPAVAVAQSPKPGDYYEDATELGFKVKMPKGWSFTPPSPGEPNLIGSYVPRNSSFRVGQGSMRYQAWLLRFDAEEEDPEAPKSAKEARKRMRTTADVGAWIEQNLRGEAEVIKEKDYKIAKREAKETVFEVGIGIDESYRLYSMLVDLREDVQIAVLFNGPGDEKKFKKLEKPFRSMAKSLKVVELEEVELSDALDDPTGLRTKKKAQLLDQITRTPGWELHETPNYFVISSVDDKEFLKELMDRLEAIRAIYTQDYDAEEAKRIRAEAAAAAKEKEPKPDPSERRSTTQKADPMEVARTSVVRVCSNRAEYSSYGGPGGSAGYWSSGDEELVIFDDQESGGRRNTWAVLNHEAFHQYIYYFYGNLAPHSWYNEGTGDFYSGYAYKNKKFKLKPFDWRVGTIKEAMRDNKYVPLKELVKFTQREYYGDNKYSVGGGQNYAQGWSLIYFLRTGRKKSKKWNSDWNNILDTYLTTLALTGDLDAAVEKAYAGVDWEELTEAWLAFKY